MVFLDYFKIGWMYLSKFYSFKRYVLGRHFECLKVSLYQLPYVLKQPRTKKKVEKSRKLVEATLVINIPVGAECQPMQEFTHILGEK